MESNEYNDFTDEDRKLLETLAYHVGFAFNRIKQHEEEEVVELENRRKLDYALGRLDHAEKVTTMVKGELIVLPDKIPDIDPGNGVKMPLRGKRNVLYICTFSEDEPWQELRS